MRIMMVSLAASFLLLAGTAGAQSKSIAGTWNAQVTTPQGSGAPTLTFAVKGDSVTGTVKRPNETVPLKGTLKGKDLTYSYTINVQGQSVPVTVTAKVMGDSIVGKLDFAGQMTGDMVAKRATPPKK